MVATLAILLAVGGAAASRSDPADARIHRLEHEALEARREQIGLLIRAVRMGECRDYRGGGSAVRLLAAAEVGAGRPAAGVAWLGRWVSALRGHEAWLKDEMGQGVGHYFFDFLPVKEARLEAEVEVFRLREACGLAGADPGAKLAVYQERTKFLAAVEQMVEKAIAAEAGDRAEHLRLKAARLDAEVALAKLTQSAK